MQGLEDTLKSMISHFLWIYLKGIYYSIFDCILWKHCLITTSYSAILVLQLCYLHLYIYSRVFSQGTRRFSSIAFLTSDWSRNGWHISESFFMPCLWFHCSRSWKILFKFVYYAFLVLNFEVLCPGITQLSQIKAAVFLNGYNEYYAFKHFYSEDLVVLFAMTFFKYQLTIWNCWGFVTLSCMRGSILIKEHRSLFTDVRAACLLIFLYTTLSRICS